MNEGFVELAYSRMARVQNDGQQPAAMPNRKEMATNSETIWGGVEELEVQQQRRRREEADEDGLR
jgi:hypothetical protein